MNVDLAIHQLAFREADTLGAAQVLVARRQNELTLKLMELRADHPGEIPVGEGLTLVDKALAEVEAKVEETTPDDGTGAVVDRTV